MSSNEMKPRIFWYFVDDFSSTYLDKNVGVLLDFFSRNGYGCMIVSNKKTDKPVPYEVVWLPNIRVKGIIFFWPSRKFISRLLKSENIIFGYLERGHVFLLCLLSLLRLGKVILKTDSCITRIMKRGGFNLLQKLIVIVPTMICNMVITEVAKSQEVLSNYVPKDKIFVLPNGSSAREWTQERKSKTIVYVGRLLEVKGADIAINSFQNILKHFPDWKLKVVGYPSDNHFVERIKDMINYPASIELIEGTEKTRLLQILSESAICLLTSREEGFSNTIPDAMMAGNVIVATAVGDTPYFSQGNTDVFLCEPTNDSATTTLLHALLKHGNLGSINNVKFAKENLSWHDNLVKFKNQLISMRILPQ